MSVESIERRLRETNYRIRRGQLLFCLYLCCSVCGAQTALVHAHAHNDYEHDRPLLQAMESGFISVEADVHAIDDKLYVSHDPPEDLARTPKLEDLYFEPLRRHINANEGRVYPNYDGFFYLMIDIKTEANTSYDLLLDLLKKYESILSVVTEGEDQLSKPVKVFLSGNRPIEALLNDDMMYAGLDGRPGDLSTAYPVAHMPVVSDNYRNFLTWRGEGSVDADEISRLKSMIDQAHEQGKLVRLWAAPDHPKMWAYLLATGVDLINTDRLEEFRAFMETYGEK